MSASHFFAQSYAEARQKFLQAAQPVALTAAAGPAVADRPAPPKAPAAAPR